MTDIFAPDNGYGYKRLALRDKLKEAEVKGQRKVASDAQRRRIRALPTQVLELIELATNSDSLRDEVFNEIRRRA